MKTNFGIHVIIVRILLFLVLATTAEALFFDYPRKVLMEFFQSLKEKKEAKKTIEDYHHVHHHYYPVPINIISEHPVKAPETYELDYLHNKRLRSLGWTEHEYKFVPEPEISVSSGLHGSFSLGFPEKHPWEGSDESHSDLKQRKVPEITVHAPLHQEIFFHQEAPKSEEKNDMLSTFLRKIQTAKSIIFHKDKNPDKCQDKVAKPIVNNKLKAVNAYMVYFQPKTSRNV